MSRKQSAVFHTLFSLLSHFAAFFCLIAFVVTCTFLLFFSSITLSEADIRTFAPGVFFNIFALAAFFVAADVIRRKIAVERPTKEIQAVLQKLMKGDFSARVSLPYRIGRENRFRDVGESINRLAEELAGVETLRTDFIANVSHELKTPLAVMQNYGTLLQQPALSDDLRLEYARAITGASRRLSSLITNILKLNKLENQQIFPAAEDFDLSEQLCESLLEFEDAWEKKELTIEAEIAEDVIICSDAELLRLVWSNLISNAVKFTPPGGTISVKLAQEGDFAVVQVSDTGCGMKPETGAHIFEKFYQGDPSHATQGNGLGLALVRRVVDIMQGEIGVESIYGKGSTFTVKFRRQPHEKLETHLS